MKQPSHLALALFSASAIIAASTTEASAQIVWTGAVGEGIFVEANWDLTASSVTVLDYTIPILDNVEFVGPGQSARIADLPGQEAFTVADGFTMVIDNMRVFAAANDGVGSETGASIGLEVNVVNGGLFEPYFVRNNTFVNVDSTSRVYFLDPANPVNGSTVNLTFGALLDFRQESPDEFRAEHLSKVRVDGAQAVEGVNIRIDPLGNNGSTISVLPGDVGTNYCPANINSSGVGAEMGAFGTANVASNQLNIEATSMPALVFGFFIVSRLDGFVANPGGSEGNLCLSGEIGRYVAPGQIQNSGLAGTISLALDLGSLPQPLGPVAAVPGETWRFQCWFRDSVAGVTTSNFSDGIAVMML